MKDLRLKEHERIINEVRQAGLTTIWQWLFGLLFILVAAFFMFWLFQHDWWGQSIFALLLVIGFVVLFRTYFVWKNSVCFITTHRVVDVERSGFLNTVVSEVPYDQIEDVSGKIVGFFGTIFRYGYVDIQTGGGTVKIILQKIQRPVQLQQQINEMRERYISKYSHDFCGDVAGVIIEKLYELEVPELTRIKNVVEKRIQKLNK